MKTSSRTSKKKYFTKKVLQLIFLFSIALAGQCQTPDSTMSKWDYSVGADLVSRYV